MKSLVSILATTLIIAAVGHASAEERPSCFASVIKVYSQVAPTSNPYTYNIGVEAVIQLTGELSARKKVFTSFDIKIYDNNGTKNISRVEQTLVSPDAKIWHVISIGPEVNFFGGGEPHIISADVSDMKCYPVVF